MLEAALADCKPKERASLIAALERLHEILIASSTPNEANPGDQQARHAVVELSTRGEVE